MPRLNEMYPSRWLSTKDVEEDTLVTIKTIDEEKIGGEDKWVLYFREIDKGLVLNQTNAKSIAKLHGEDTDDWLGKRIVLFPTEVQFKGDMVDAIRVRSKAPKPAAAKVAAAKVAPMTQDEADDELADADPPPF